MPSADKALERITRFYLDSHDFNGIPTHTLLQELGCDPDSLKTTLADLIRSEQASAVFGDVHPNPHIRALPDHPPAKQLQLLEERRGLSYCIYPTRKTLEGFVDRSKYAGMPFKLMLALGEPQLKHLAFDLSVLEAYRNDPRYHYTTDDISGTISVTGQHYESAEMNERDKVLLQSFGFAYNERLDRAVAVFLRYLADLSPEHQQIWQARLLGPEYRLHPDYYRSSFLAEWPERISIFEAFIGEIQTLNAMSTAMGRPSLFRSDFKERPRGFGFLIRPTVREFNDFVLLLDKMMSENIDRDFFQSDISLEREEPRADGRVIVSPKGTIQVLEEWLGKNFRTKDPKPLQEAIQGFREVRQLRQKPAHAVNQDAFDMGFVHQQRELMMKAYGAVRLLRLLFENHPLAKQVKVSEELREGKIWTY